METKVKVSDRMTSRSKRRCGLQLLCHWFYWEFGRHILETDLIRESSRRNVWSGGMGTGMKGTNRSVISSSGLGCTKHGSGGEDARTFSLACSPT